MSDYEVGYKKPPKHTQFKKGTCPNPRGRGRKEPQRLEAAMKNVLYAPIEFSENGRPKKASRLEVEIRKTVAQALMGNVDSAIKLLKMRSHAIKYGDSGPIVIEIKGGLPAI